MPTRFRRAARNSAQAPVETLERRELLSALGFGSTIRPAHAHQGAGLVVPMGNSHDQGAATPLSAPFTPFSDFSLHSTAHILLNNNGYNAVSNAQDSVLFSAGIGTVQLPVAFAMASTPQTTIARVVPGGIENLYIVIDWGDGSPQTLGTFQSSSRVAYTIAGAHAWTAPGDYRLTAFLIASGPGSDLPFVLHAAVGVAHVDATASSTQPPITLHLPLYDPQHYVPPAYPQITLPTSTPTDPTGFSKVYDYVVA